MAVDSVRGGLDSEMEEWRERQRELREGSDDHPYGAWSGGPKSAGGHPATGGGGGSAAARADAQVERDRSLVAMGGGHAREFKTTEEAQAYHMAQRRAAERQAAAGKPAPKTTGTGDSKRWHDPAGPQGTEWKAQADAALPKGWQAQGDDWSGNLSVWAPSKMGAGFTTEVGYVQPGFYPNTYYRPGAGNVQGTWYFYPHVSSPGSSGGYRSLGGLNGKPTPREAVRAVVDAARADAGLLGLREGANDHFYGAWKGGSAKSGGGPAKGGGGGKAPASEEDKAAAAAAKRDAHTKAGKPVSPDQAIKDLEAGKRPHVEPKDVSAVLAKTALRDDHLDLTELQVQGTLKFGGDGLGIARKNMPQLPGDKLPDYLQTWRNRGVGVTRTSVDPVTLKPMQKEVSATKVGQMLGVMRTGQLGAGDIVITRDNYVLDGHHRWGAGTALAFERSGVKVPVVRIDRDGRDVLRDALQWTRDQGIGTRSLSEADRWR
jgi:hypothetical protein